MKVNLQDLDEFQLRGFLKAILILKFIPEERNFVLGEPTLELFVKSVMQELEDTLSEEEFRLLAAPRQLSDELRNVIKADVIYRIKSGISSEDTIEQDLNSFVSPLVLTDGDKEWLKAQVLAEVK